MAASHTSKASSKLDGSEITVRFSPEVTQGFANLAAAAHFSEHFDGDILAIVQDWAAGKRISVRNFMVAFPAIADETFRHIRETGDERAREAWNVIHNKIADREGFTLTDVRSRSDASRVG
jgi:hypothetical protein